MTAGHVDLVIGGQHGGGVLRVFEAAGDGLAQAGHLHPFFAGRVIGGNGRTGRLAGAGAGPQRAAGRGGGGFHRLLS
jgi:hypothetical protein